MSNKLYDAVCALRNELIEQNNTTTGFPTFVDYPKDEVRALDIALTKLLHELLDLQHQVTWQRAYRSTTQE